MKFFSLRSAKLREFIFKEGRLEKENSSSTVISKCDFYIFQFWTAKSDHGLAAEKS